MFQIVIYLSIEYNINLIDLIEKPTFARRVRKALAGKSIQVILCDVVLNEVQRVRGFSYKKIIAKISEQLNRKIAIVPVSEQEKLEAKKIQLVNVHTFISPICGISANFGRCLTIRTVGKLLLHDRINWKQEAFFKRSSKQTVHRVYSNAN